MPKNLADQLGEDTISRFQRSAPMRLAEGDLLAPDHPLAGIYLYGYAAEMIIKAAYFRNLGFRLRDEIDRDARNRASALAQSNGFLARDPHDILGWARFLIWDKETLHTPAYDAKFSSRIILYATAVYENWRPQMRYRNTSPTSDTVSTVRTATAWLIENSPGM